DIGVRFSGPVWLSSQAEDRVPSHFGTPQSSGNSGDRAEGLQGLAQPRNVFPFSFTVQGELASVTIAIALAHCPGNSSGFPRIRKSKLNFAFLPKFQFHSRHYAHPPFANLCASSFS